MNQNPWWNDFCEENKNFLPIFRDKLLDFQKETDFLKTSDEKAKNFLSNQMALTQLLAFMRILYRKWSKPKSPRNKFTPPMNNPLPPNEPRQDMPATGNKQPRSMPDAPILSQEVNHVTKDTEKANSEAYGLPKLPPAIKFWLPNASVKKAYVGEIHRWNKDGKSPAKVRNLRIDAGWDLAGNADCKVEGIPSCAGDCTVAFEYWDGKNWWDASCKLIVNPDPSQLWRERDPDDTAHPRKEHQKSGRCQAQYFDLLGASLRGRSHAHNGGFREDDMAISVHGNWFVMVVADGAGSAKLSRRGSELAVGVMKDALARAIAEHGERWSGSLDGAEEMVLALEEEFRVLLRASAQTVIAEIGKEAQQAEELPLEYATTLLAAFGCMQADSLLLASLWVGDGALGVWAGEGGITLMGRPDSGEYSGQTRFLDEKSLNKEDLIKVARISAAQSVFLMTDGVSDPRFETEQGLESAQKWGDLHAELAPILAMEDAESELLDWLKFWSPGNHDDRTVAMLLRKQGM